MDFQDEFLTSAMISIVKQGNVPSPLKSFEELAQRSRPFGEGFVQNKLPYVHSLQDATHQI